MTYKSWEDVPFDSSTLSEEEKATFEKKFFIPSAKEESENQDESSKEEQHDLIPAISSSFESFLARIDEFDKDGNVEVYRHNTAKTLLIIINYNPTVKILIKEYDDAYEVLSYEICYAYDEPNKDAWIQTRLDTKMFRLYNPETDEEEES